MKFIGWIIGSIVDYHTWKWIYENPIVIPIIIIYFIPYFFIVPLLDFVSGWGVPYVSSSTILVIGLIGYTLLTVYIVIKVVLYIDDQKE